MAWLSGWNRRKSKTINGSTAGAQSDYQMLKIRVHKDTGTDTASGANGTLQHVYVGANVRDDFGDVTFTKEDGTTLLDFWMETYVSGDYADFYVEVDSIPESPDTIDVYVYYDKSDETTTSDMDDTFIAALGDATAWTEYDPNEHITLEDNKVTLASVSTAEDARVAKAISVSDDFIIEWDEKWSDWAHFMTVAVGDSDAQFPSISNAVGAGLNQLGRAYAVRRTAGVYDSGGDDTLSLDTQYYSRLKRVGSNLVYYVYSDAAWTTLVTSATVTGAPTGTLTYAFCWNSHTDVTYVGSAILENYRIRKYTDPEPSWGAFGSEETEVAVAYMRPMKYW